MLYELTLSFKLHLHPLIVKNLRNLGLRVSHPFAFYALTRRYRVAVMTFVELFSEQKHEFLATIKREAMRKELILSDTN